MSKKQIKYLDFKSIYFRVPRSFLLRLFKDEGHLKRRDLVKLNRLKRHLDEEQCKINHVRSIVDRIELRRIDKQQ